MFVLENENFLAGHEKVETSNHEIEFNKLKPGTTNNRTVNSSSIHRGNIEGFQVKIPTRR